MGIMDNGWRENSIYPGVHWLFYDTRGNYRARVDLYAWENGMYRWRVMEWSSSKIDATGLEASLQAAQYAADQFLANERQRAADQVVVRVPAQLRLF